MSPRTSGVLCIDKGPGLTSHDVVAVARRALGTRAVGHAGTLDPMATGVLVLAFGEGTKLVQYLTGQDKTYEATLMLGVATDSLDADGQVTETREVPKELDVPGALARFVGALEQLAPVVSAIKRGGVRLHDAHRRGEVVEPPVRRVTVHELSLLSATSDTISFRVRASKGFYVRSLGRDLAQALGTVGHLTALRRIASGMFGLERAVPMEALREAARDPSLRPALLDRALGLREAWGAAPVGELTPEGVVHARHGKALGVADFVSSPAIDIGGVAALTDGQGSMIALARRDEDAFRVARGIHDPAEPC